MSDRRVFRWATTSARMLAGTVVSVAAVIAVVTAVSLPWPTLTLEPVSVSAEPAPAASVLACDGGLLALGRDPSDAAAVTLASPQSVTSGVSAGPAAEERELETIGVPGAGTLALTAQPYEDARVDVAASGSSTVAADDLAGFAASACRPPLLESWLVGGSAATGAADLVLLSNPGVVAAAVSLTVYGAAGAQTPPGGSDIIVAPGTQRVVPLAGLALGEESPVVRVSALGAPIHAALQTSITRTLTTGGVDQVGPVTLAERNQTITGVAVRRSSSGDGASGEVTVLRMLAPSTDATAQVTVTPVGRGAAREPQEVALVAGQPVEVALPGLSAGLYTVDVVADAPVVSAVWQATGTGEGDDFAWLTPAPKLSAPTMLAAPSGPTPVLSIVNAEDADVRVRVRTDTGADVQEVVVPASGSVSVRLQPRGVYVLDPDATVRAALSLSGDGAIAGFPVWPADAAAPEIVVYP